MEMFIFIVKEFGESLALVSGFTEVIQDLLIEVIQDGFTEVID
jgi:hypothetical protein